MTSRPAYNSRPPVKIFPARAVCLLIFFFLSACGGGKSSGNGEQGGEGDNVFSPKKWESQKVISLNPSAGILTPRVEAQPGKDGKVHIAYFDGNSPLYQLNYLVYDTENPLSAEKKVVLTADNSSGLSLSVDTAGVPVIAYQAGEVREAGSPKQSDAMFSILEGGWVEYTAGVGFVGRNPVFEDGLAGSDLSVAFDSRGDIHIVYQFRYEGIDALNYAYPDLLYVKKVRSDLGAVAAEETVEGNLFTNGTASVQNVVGAFCTVAVDLNDLPIVFYYAETDNIKGLKVARRQDGNWVSEWVEKGIELGGISRAIFDNNGNPGVAYFVRDSKNGEKNYLRYAHREGTASWALETVDDSIHGGRYPSLAFDSSGRPAIAYYAEMTYTKRELNDLRFSRFNGLKWEHEYVATEGDTGLYNSLWFDQADRPVIVTYSKIKIPANPKNSKIESSIMIYSGRP